MENIIKLKTDNEKLLFIGYDGHEEYYLDLDEASDFGGWSFMGLRPATESELRERQREIEPEDMGVVIPPNVIQYFDYDQFHLDMEEDWYEMFDVQAERVDEDSDETLYLGFGSGQDIKGYFEEHNINSYEDYVNHFEFVGLDETEFNDLLKKIN